MFITDERKEVNGKLLGRVLFEETERKENDFLEEYVSIIFKDITPSGTKKSNQEEFLDWVGSIKEEPAHVNSFFFTEISNMVIEAGGSKRTALLEEFKDQVLSLIE